MMTNNKMIAITKLTNLQTALAACGITSEIYEMDCSGTHILALRCDELWNCANSSDVLLEVYAEDTDDFQDIQHYVQPDDSLEKVFGEGWQDVVAEAGEIAKEL